MLLLHFGMVNPQLTVLVLELAIDVPETSTRMAKLDKWMLLHVTMVMPSSLVVVLTVESPSVDQNESLVLHNSSYVTDN